MKGSGAKELENNMWESSAHEDRFKKKKGAKYCRKAKESRGERPGAS